MTLSEKLRLMAVDAGAVCDRIEGWGDNESAATLMERYKAMPDWCMERQYPGIAFMAAHFDSSEMRDRGFYVNQRKLNMNAKTPVGAGVLVFNNCSGVVRIPDYTLARVYVGLDSEMKFEVGVHASLMLDYWDSSKITVRSKSSVMSRLYQHGRFAPDASGSVITACSHGKPV